MSFFAVTVEEVSEILPHSNADRLSIARLKNLGFQFIIAKDTWKVGDKCLYFPLDALLPEELLAKMNLTGKLAGGAKNRVKTIKLRGEISQGLVGPLSLIDNLVESERSPEKITEFLGVTKYEAEINLPKSEDGRLVDLPPGVGIYDIEGCERYLSVMEELLDEPVWISEKLEGSHFAISCIDQKVWVCQRRFAIELLSDKPKHFFWEVSENQGLIELIQKISALYNSNSVTLRGEIVGPNIQKNHYRFEDRHVYFFDLLLEHKYVDVDEFFSVMEKFSAVEMIVPTLSKGVPLRDWLGDKTIQAAADGQSLLHKVPREGIVIKPMRGRLHNELSGRLVLKQRSPVYLAGEE